MSDQRPVLVVTQLDDPTADLVVAALNERNVPVVRFDTADFPTHLSFAATVGAGDTRDDRGAFGGIYNLDNYCHIDGVGGWLRARSRTVLLSAVRSLYYRRPSAFVFPEMAPQDRAFAILQARYGLGGVLTSLPGCLYVNHPHRIADAELKPAQLAVAAEVGFTVPPTLVTNDPAAARAFAGAVGPVVYKPLRLLPYADAEGQTRTVWVREVDAADFDETMRHTVHLVQAKVEKAADIRVTVIGREVFAVRIDGEHLDWRRDYSTLQYAVMDIPDHVIRAVRAYLERFGLMFGAFDFALDANDVLVFLECNPNGQWAWLEEEHAGLPMTAALADLLARGCVDGR